MPGWLVLHLPSNSHSILIPLVLSRRFTDLLQEARLHALAQLFHGLFEWGGSYEGKIDTNAYCCIGKVLTSIKLNLIVVIGS